MLSHETTSRILLRAVSRIIKAVLRSMSRATVREFVDCGRRNEPGELSRSMILIDDIADLDWLRLALAHEFHEIAVAN